MVIKSNGSIYYNRIKYLTNPKRICWKGRFLFEVLDASCVHDLSFTYKNSGSGRHEIFYESGVTVNIGKKSSMSPGLEEILKNTSCASKLEEKHHPCSISGLG